MIYYRAQHRFDMKQVASLEAADEGGKGSTVGSSGGRWCRISSATSSLLTLMLAVKPQTSVLPWKTNCTAISREIRKQMMRINNSFKRKGKEDGRVIINFKSSLFFKTL